MPRHSRWATYALALALACATTSSSRAQQMRYLSGQNIVAVFEGCERNPDGTFNMVFGYLNRNYEEEVDIPIGPSNNIEPGGDRGQPTHFLTRRQRFVFKVVVPEDWGNRDVIWTLTAHGKTEKAYGSLLPVWELDPGVIGANRGGAGTAGSTATSVPNQPPSIEEVGDQMVTLPNSLTLAITVTDDGFPKPRQLRERGYNRFKGLTVTWIPYRGLGKVTFDPVTPPITDGKAVTKASFSAPGSYVLRAIADDGALFTQIDVKVAVNPASSAQVRH